MKGTRAWVLHGKDQLRNGKQIPLCAYVLMNYLTRCKGLIYKPLWPQGAWLGSQFSTLNKTLCYQTNPQTCVNDFLCCFLQPCVDCVLWSIILQNFFYETVTFLPEDMPKAPLLFPSVVCTSPVPSFWSILPLILPPSKTRGEAA